MAEAAPAPSARFAAHPRPRPPRRHALRRRARRRPWSLPGLVFDEHYHVHDARVLLRGDLAGSASEPWKPAALRSAAHPDLAKLAVAAGIGIVGDGPWGWRLPGALAGVVLIALVFPVARRLGLSDEWALAALVLAAADPMLMLHSRLAVLDVYVAVFTVSAVFLALRYVQSGFCIWWLVACGATVRAPSPPSGPASLPRPP